MASMILTGGASTLSKLTVMSWRDRFIGLMQWTMKPIIGVWQRLFGLSL